MNIFLRPARKKGCPPYVLAVILTGFFSWPSAFAGAIDNEQINYGSSCSGTNNGADWDTIFECNGSTWQRGVYFLGASSDTCDTNHAGLMRYNSASSIVQYCNSATWVTFGGNGVRPSYSGVTNAIAIAQGIDDAFYINTSNAAYAVGVQYVGELGNGTVSSTYVSSPAAVSGGYSWSKISTGELHACGLTTANAMYCWGDNSVGEIGIGSTTPAYESTPTALVSPYNGYTWTDVAVLGVDSANSSNYYNITAAMYAACGLSGGNVYCWGNNAAGQLGTGNNTASTSPTLVSGGTTFSSLAKATGSYSAHMCAITSAGAAYCWGANVNGQLGNNSTSNSNVPVLVSGGYTWSQLAIGTQHTCGVTTGNAAYCWGNNGQGQLGNGTSTQSLVPSAVSGGLSFSKMAAGVSSTCGITTGGVAYCWGSNGRASLGLGPGSWLNNYSTPQAVTIPSGISSTGWTDIYLSYNGAAGVNAGSVYSWGQPSYNNFGDPYYTSLAPVQSY